MFDEVIEGLARIGLNEKEAKVYMALLSRPGARVQDLASSVDVPRGTCYGILDDLVERGYVNTGEAEAGRIYFPQSPAQLLNLLKVEEREISDRIRVAESFVPSLTVLYNPMGARPHVKYREGAKGLRELQMKFEALEEDILQIVGYDAFLALHDPKTTSEHRTGIGESPRHVRAIIVTDQLDKVPVIPNGEVRVIPTSFMNISGEISVCGDRVAFLSYDSDMIVLEVHSPAIAGTCKAALELAWKQAGEIVGKL